MIPSLLWTDWYQFTMAFPIWKYYRNLKVRYAFKNRSLGIKLTDHINVRALQQDVDDIRAMRFSQLDLKWITDQKIFPEGFIWFLENLRLPEVEIEDRNGWLSIEYEGDWPEAIFWETPLLALVMTHYMRDIVKDNLGFTDAHREGNKRLTQKFSIYQEHPELPGFMEFATRRPFPGGPEDCYSWQQSCLGRAIATIPEKVLGTSNPYLAKHYDIPVSGTQAHQMSMIIGAHFLAQGGRIDPLADAQKMVLDVWEACYRGIHDDKYLCFLPDTFTTPFFLRNVEPERIMNWRRWRQDSGDPFAKCDEIFDKLKELHIDPETQTLIPSNGLDINLMLALHYHLENRIPHVFGWGGNFANDVGIDMPQIVIKPKSVTNGVGTVSTVKLSDDMSKATGTKDDINRYKELVS